MAKLSALKDGLRARTVVLPGEDREEFHKLCDDLEAEWQPQSRSEQFYVEQMAVSQWKLTRLEVAEHGLYAENAKVPMLDRMWKAQHSMERAYAQAQRELERLQKSRRVPAQVSKLNQVSKPSQVRQAISPVDFAAADIAPSVSAGAPPAATASVTPRNEHPKSPPPY